jgi:hypothetical protein
MCIFTYTYWPKKRQPSWRLSPCDTAVLSQSGKLWNGRPIPHTTAPFQHRPPVKHATHPHRTPYAGKRLKSWWHTWPCERFPPLYMTITNKNTRNSSPHWIRNRHPTTQNYYPTATSTYIYIYFIYCTYINICFSYKKTTWLAPRFFLVCM